MFQKKILLILIIINVSCNKKKEKIYSYPFIPSIPVIDTYHGTSIEDPYRNLENLKDSTVIQWFAAQENYARTFLNVIPRRDSLLAKQLVFDKRQESTISKIKIHKNKTVFYLKRKRGEEFDKLYLKRPNEQEKLVYNPTDYKTDHIINYFKVSWDATKVAISLVKKGENISDLLVYDLVTKKINAQIIQKAKPKTTGGINWLPDDSGFIYQNFPNTDHQSKEYMTNTRAVLHKLDMDTTQVIEVFSKKNNPSIPMESADFPIVNIKSDKADHIFGIIGGVSKYDDTYYATINKETNYTNLNWKLLFKKEDQIDSFFTDTDELIYLTSKDASNFKICKTSIQHPDFKNPTVLVEEKKDRVITDFEYIDGELFYVTIKNGVESKFFSKKNGVEEEIQLPLASGNTYISHEGDTLKVSLYSWTQPNQVYTYNIEKREFSLLDLNTKTNFPEFNDFVVEEIEVPSHDGIKIPLSVIYKKGLKKDGNNRLISLSYGAYGASFSPYFMITLLTWVNEGNIWVLPHVRGGGEKGDAWHKAGFKTTKSNSWKDLISCTEYLIKEGYTSPELNVAFGTSAAGITIGRAITERPDLFEVALMSVPSINLVRSEIQPNGPNSIKEFGTVEIKEEFEALYEMDAYHHIEKNIDYPAILISTGMNDGAVVPWDPAKFVAKMQATNPNGKPTLFSVDFNANHGGDGTMDYYYKNMADAFSFALWQTGHPDYQPKE
ncbi:prolyl oligopeptidase family serine peptidase [Aquimarina algiphila]|uniref:prolyl oligopeptidase n=1 Tax=Aquimarina algiphila TaxID=2047982 RepID=A0A554VBG2_9FLAO|nr:prolyl oligopeptidase family serine peptidase [Aquimarina algiphila]TSE03809.1 prolyl oligopeptidase family serine peptidase [Aquimarina algiphila]